MKRRVTVATYTRGTPASAIMLKQSVVKMVMAPGLEPGERRFDPYHSDFGLLVIMVAHRICTAKVRVRFSYSPPSKRYI